MKKDSRVKSLIEAIFNIFVGFSINFVANIIVLPYFGFAASTKVYFMIGLVYTIISIARSYLLRRLFVNGFYEWILRVCRKWIL